MFSPEILITLMSKVIDNISNMLLTLDTVEFYLITVIWNFLHQLINFIFPISLMR